MNQKIKHVILSILLVLILVVCIVLGMKFFEKKPTLSPPTSETNTSETGKDNTSEDTSTTETQDTDSETTNITFVDGIEYTLSEDGTYYTLSEGSKYTGNKVVVPEEINGVPVTVIGSHAFYRCSNITEVSLPETIVSIETDAFSGCSITNINLPDSLKTIGQGAFCWCKFSSIELPQGLETIGKSAFFSCSELTSLTIPSSVTYLEYGLVTNCPKLTTLQVEEGNPVYHSSGNCIIETQSKTLITGISTSVIPQDGSVTRIGDCAFIYSPDMTHFSIPEGITHIGQQAFDQCHNLTSIELPESLTVIGQWQFHACKNLKDIYYRGTLVQWNQVNKRQDWAPGYCDYTIHCKDGNLFVDIEE